MNRINDKKVKIACVFGEQLLLEGLITVLEGYHSKFSINGFSTMEHFLINNSLDYRVVLIDSNFIFFKNENQFVSAINTVRSKNPHIKIVALTDNVSFYNINEFFAESGLACVSKFSSYREVNKAIEMALDQQRFVCQMNASQSRNSSRFLLGLDQTLKPLYQIFTSAENKVLQNISKGYSTKQIASLLNLFEKTIETHRKHLFDKSGVKNVAELMTFAFKNNLIHL